MKAEEGRFLCRYEPGVYMLMGVNGIGKSTIVDKIAAANPEVTPMYASKELSNIFGGISRENMELLRPEDKLAKMVLHFTQRFDDVLSKEGAVILDTHLLVPIRKGFSVLYEDIWSDIYTPYVSAAVMLSAEPSSIRAWRLRDEIDTGRKRNTSVDDILSDQEQNIARFKSLQANGSFLGPSEIVTNEHGRLDEARLAIESIFKHRMRLGL